MQETDRAKRRTWLRRFAIGLALSLLAAPVQDFGLAFTEILVSSLVEVEQTFVAQILAPINSVGSLLSMLLLGLRIMHKRIFEIG